MTGKIFRSVLLAATVVLLCSLVVVMGVLLNHFDRMQVRQLQNELRLAAIGTEQNKLAYLENLEPDEYRLTWVSSRGIVMFDTLENQTVMENHGNRQEIRQALETGSGSSVRYSDTRMEKTVYQALRLGDGSVLRISVSTRTAMSLALGLLPSVSLVVLLAIALSAVLAHRMAVRIVRPLNTLDLEHPMDNRAYAEISPLLERIAQQHRQIASQMKKLKRQTEEFEQITCHMKEGLVLLDKNSLVLSINPAAKALFGVDERCVGRDFLTVDRKLELLRSAPELYRDGRSSIREERNGREYQFELSPIASDGKTVGGVVLALDVTEQTQAEQMRREFSANVSHELKSPLQAIIGSAELLENGMVRPADQGRFVGHIRREATRLVNLVEDIIRLSQLDEGEQLPREPVDLPALGREVLQALEPAAREKQVSCTLAGDGFPVSGVRRLLYEILYNLCDNAIKYNRPGGTVTLILESRNRTIQVIDTGIGIPPEHQARIFERFYRVDKSHSRASGGTGLGLSICKHAVAAHNGKISLTSTPGQGTAVTVTLPG